MEVIKTMTLITTNGRSGDNGADVLAVSGVMAVIAAGLQHNGGGHWLVDADTGVGELADKKLSP